MKIVQLTDLHVGVEGADAHGVDVRRNLEIILDKVPAERADRIVVTGDLCLMDGQREVYEWIRERFAGIQAPVSWLSGNHDDPVLLAESLGLTNQLRNGELYSRQEWSGHSVLCLDTSPARMSLEQKAWLREQLQQPNHPQLIFMHHPPTLAGLPFMDNNHAFREREELAAIWADATHPLHIFCGHYHTECTLQHPGFTVYITPSTYFQIDRNYPDFAVDHRRIAYRWIEWDDQILRTGVRYFDGAASSKEE